MDTLETRIAISESRNTGNGRFVSRRFGSFGFEEALSKACRSRSVRFMKRGIETGLPGTSVNGDVQGRQVDAHRQPPELPRIRRARDIRVLVQAASGGTAIRFKDVYQDVTGIVLVIVLRRPA